MQENHLKAVPAPSGRVLYLTARSFTLLFLAILLAGCDVRIERFEPNQVYGLSLARSRSTPAEVATDDAAKVVDALFGTPDEPQWPAEFVAESTASPLIDPDRLARAAGPISSDKDGRHRGLFREHCVVCHGLSGSGAGPASVFQNPYPRDFRHGIFKWKSTARAAKPTHDDIRGRLLRGIPGVAMPSFAALKLEDLESLVDYVIYLSVRGEVERRLAAAAIDELGYAETRPEEEEWRLRHGGADTDGSQVVDEIVLRVVNSWREAPTAVIPVPAATALQGQELEQSIGRGKGFFHGPIVNCVGCHGPGGSGHVATLDYDDWSKEYSTRIGLTPGDREAMRPFRKAGALRPRPIKPRNLQAGVFRGSGDGETLFRRITQGIAGTPMPAVEVVDEISPKGLTESQVWDLVRYIQSLSASE
jgi:mono/diheme cytochrome c family protein